MQSLQQQIAHDHGEVTAAATYFKMLARLQMDNRGSWGSTNVAQVPANSGDVASKVRTGIEDKARGGFSQLAVVGRGGS